MIQKVENVNVDNDRGPFEVELTGQLGMIISIDESPDYLTVDAVQRYGAIADWNDSHAKDLLVSPGDLITCINGHAHTGVDMLKELHAYQKSTDANSTIKLEITPGKPILKLRRFLDHANGGELSDRTLDRVPFQMQVVTNSERRPMGAAASICDPTCLTIEEVNPNGLIAEYNDTQSARTRVCPGDVITSVNGAAGSGKEILRMLGNVSYLNAGVVLELQISPKMKFSKTDPGGRAII